MHDLETIFPYFNTFNEGLKKHLTTVLEKKTFSKGYMLLREGYFCKRVYFLAEGLVRGFYNRKGKELTSWFATEGDILTSMRAFVNQEISKENIEILENSVLYALTYQQLQDIYQKYPDFNAFGRLLAEQYYIELEEHSLSMQFDTATERYENFVQTQGKLLLRLSLGHLASYLGISQETLSRIRSKNL